MSGREAARSREWAQHFSNASCLLGPFHGAIAVPSVTRCRCRHCRRCRWRRGHRCAGGARKYRWRHLVNGREAARGSEWAQHFSNASCSIVIFTFRSLAAEAALALYKR